MNSWAGYNQGTNVAMSVGYLNAGVTLPNTGPNGFTSDNNWHWQTISIDRTLNTVSFYVDNHQIESGSITVVNPTISLNAMRIGGATGPNQGTYGFIGTIDEFAVWNRAFSQTDMNTLTAVPEVNGTGVVGILCLIGGVKMALNRRRDQALRLTPV